jgi:hypothetical protein
MPAFDEYVTMIGLQIGQPWKVAPTDVAIESIFLIDAYAPVYGTSMPVPYIHNSPFTTHHFPKLLSLAINAILHRHFFSSSD